jgi:hypothetical protein
MRSITTSWISTKLEFNQSRERWLDHIIEKVDMAENISINHEVGMNSLECVQFSSKTLQSSRSRYRTAWYFSIGYPILKVFKRAVL